MDKIKTRFKLETLPTTTLIDMWNNFNLAPYHCGYWDERFPDKPYLFDLLPFDCKRFKRFTKFHYLIEAMKMIEMVVGQRKIIEELNKKQSSINT
ncbi:hypothetical protein [Dielma fastidiosa]|uniref:Uncharacterized protein n=1 Tax=Dielma fastidiosa TaxID=1034346 RepID=A0A318KDL3_9FIRM|nr:hypothetical protein [Dielma fastidiosa]PXX75309.1 hypothetical protein DES51_11839 [Dielma fastidiosa]